MVAVLLGVEDPVFDEDGDGPQHERHEQVHVDEVPGAVQLPTPAASGGRGLETVSPQHPNPHHAPGLLWAAARLSLSGVSHPDCPISPT